MVESISKKAAGRLSLGCANAAVVPFLALFCLVGIGVGTFLSFLPIYRAIQSRSWRAATLRSAVEPRRPQRRHVSSGHSVSLRHRRSAVHGTPLQLPSRQRQSL